ncbi:hypothetical protein DMN91_003972 [Ooceraea biroi]|uniref:Uncharacterized protein n=1 Tax=Ooceraea biroi TaxID=2015173 RepID=A0A3L8DTQ3_OOCBI|nr:hypothetical protein DMN91_003972 [Ooceraea biroi]
MNNMIGMRMNAFNDTGLGEPEQDANTALMELNKGLHFAKTGEQCETIEYVSRARNIWTKS